MRPGLRHIAVAASLATLPGPITAPPADPQALGRTVSRMPALLACMTPQGGPNAACVNRILSGLSGSERQALAAFIGMTGFYAEPGESGTGGDWPPGAMPGLPLAPTE